MSSPESTTPSTEKAPVSPSNPFFGCVILSIIVLTFAGIVAWVLYSGYKQDQEIGLFTVDQPNPFPQTQVTEAEKLALKQKIQTFEATIREGKAAELHLTILELNQLLVITHEADIVDYREVVQFTGFKPNRKVVEAKLHWPMNKLSLDKNAKRYLIGEADFQLYLDNTPALELLIEEVRVPGKPISPGFLGSLRQWPWLNLAKTKENIANVLKKISEIDFSEDGQTLILRAKAA